MKKQILILITLLPILLSAQSLQKVYILSEGGFSPETSQLSMLDVTNNTFDNSLLPLGLYPDGLILDGDNMYVTEQGSWGSQGKAYILDSLGTILDTTNFGLNPYSIAKANNKLYVTNGGASNVSVLDAVTLNQIKEISVGVYPQEILAINEYVFVANNSIWDGDSDSTVSVIDAELDSVVATITVRLNPSSLAKSADGYLLIGCPGDENTAMIFKVDLESFTKIDSFSVTAEGFGTNISIDPNSNNIYFISNMNNIVELNLNSKAVRKIVPSNLGANYFYGYAFDYTTNQHYVLDAKDFAINGNLTIYDNDGNSLNTYETSIAPRRVVFKYNEAPTDINVVETLPLNFALNQNYPNPFNPTTRISFKLAVDGKTELNVYNSLGQKVAELVNSNLSAGSYEFAFNAENLSSGIYFYTLRAESFVQTRKMMLLK